MPINDSGNEFSVSQAVTATANGTNTIDLGAALADVAVGTPLFVDVHVDVLPVSAGASTLIVSVVDDDNAALASPATLASSASYLKAALGAGTNIRIHIPPGVNTQRYLGIVYTVGTANYSAGNFTARLRGGSIIQASETYLGTV